jgi:hypothetical protein
VEGGGGGVGAEVDDMTAPAPDASSAYLVTLGALGPPQARRHSSSRVGRPMGIHRTSPTPSGKSVSFPGGGGDVILQGLAQARKRQARSKDMRSWNASGPSPLIMLHHAQAQVFSDARVHETCAACCKLAPEQQGRVKVELISPSQRASFSRKRQIWRADSSISWTLWGIGALTILWLWQCGCAYLYWSRTGRAEPYPDNQSVVELTAAPSIDIIEIEPEQGTISTLSMAEQDKEPVVDTEEALVLPMTAMDWVDDFIKTISTCGLEQPPAFFCAGGVGIHSRPPTAATLLSLKEMLSLPPLPPWKVDDLADITPILTVVPDFGSTPPSGSPEAASSGEEVFEYDEDQPLQELVILLIRHMATSNIHRAAAYIREEHRNIMRAVGTAIRTFLLKAGRRLGDECMSVLKRLWRMARSSLMSL